MSSRPVLTEVEGSLAMPIRIVYDDELPDPSEVAARIDLRTVLAPGRPARGDKPVLVRCRWHDDHQPSLAVYPGHAHCYSCGFHEGVFGVIAALEGLDVTADYRQVVRIAAERYAGSVPVSSSPATVSCPAPPTLPRAVAERYHRFMDDKRRWYHRRGFADWLIDEVLLGYSWERRAFAIPVWDGEGNLLALRFRRDDSVDLGRPKYWGMEGRNDVHLVNEKVLLGQGGILLELAGWGVIAEGELDALRLYQMGVPAVSVTNGVAAFSADMVPRFGSCRKVVVVYDQDPAGRGNALRVARLFGRRGLVASWPSWKGKDITEFILSFGEDEMLRLLLQAEPVARRWQ